MNHEFSATARRIVGATPSTRTVFASALMAIFAFGTIGAALAAKPKPMPTPAKVDAKPRGAAVASKQAPDVHVLIQLTAPAGVDRLRCGAARARTRRSRVARYRSRSRPQPDRCQQGAAGDVRQRDAGGGHQVHGNLPGAARDERRRRHRAGVAGRRDCASCPASSQCGRSCPPSRPAMPAPRSSAPQVWQGIPRRRPTAPAIRIGIIDTGIDYQHSNFGGTGLLADYQANDRVTLNGGAVPDGKSRRRHRPRGRQLRRERSRRLDDAGARPQSDGLPRPRLARRRHRRRARRQSTAGATFAGPYDTSTPEHAAHPARHRAEGPALRHSGLRLRRLDRSRRAGDRLGARPQRRRRPVRSPRRDQHVARVEQRRVISEPRRDGLGDRLAFRHDRRRGRRQCRRHVFRRSDRRRCRAHDFGGRVGTAAKRSPACAITARLRQSPAITMPFRLRSGRRFLRAPLAGILVVCDSRTTGAPLDQAAAVPGKSR